MKIGKLSFKWNNFFIALLILAVFITPIINPTGYLLSIMVVIGINTIVIVGLCLLMGYAGQISLGHAAFFGLGAYFSGILTAKYGISPWGAMAVGVTATGILAYFVGIPIFKLKEHYLALATLGLGIIVHMIFVEESHLTGGPSGLTGIPYLSIGNFTFDSDLKYYYLVWLGVLIAIFMAHNIVNSRVGRALRAIHGSEYAAQSLGVDANKYKLQIFALSAVYAGFAGSLYAHYVTFISPAPFGLMTSVNFVVMAVLGGLASIWGPLFGVAAVIFLGEFLREAIPNLFPQAGGEYEIIVFGLILVVVMIFMPEGLTAGLKRTVESWLAGRKEKLNDHSAM